MGKPKAQIKEYPELPRTPQIGDRIRLRPDRHHKLRQACDAAGYPFNPEAIYVVTREDSRPNGRALWFDAPPWSYYASDVELAWNDPQGPERRKAIGRK